MRRLTAVVVGLALLAATSAASASIVAFTSTTQLDNQGVVAAVDLYSVTNSTVNGVAFVNDGGGYGLTGYAGAGSGPLGGSVAGPASGPDTAAMAAIIEGMQYAGPGGYLQYTLNGLTPGQTYEFQLIGGYPAAGNFAIDFSGTPGVDEPSLSYAAGAYLTKTNFVAGASSVDVKISGGSYGYAIASGFVVSQVPEPATMSLLAIGGLGALIRRRK